MAGDSINHAKQAIRERVWELLEREHVTEPGVCGYIPAFAGAGIAARLLAGTPDWEAAQVIKAVPDREDADAAGGIVTVIGPPGWGRSDWRSRCSRSAVRGGSAARVMRARGRVGRICAAGAVRLAAACVPAGPPGRRLAALPRTGAAPASTRIRG